MSGRVQDAAGDILASLVGGGRWPQSIVIEGPAGSGKAGLARRIAQAAVCTAEGERPCGACRACRNAGNGNHPDIITLQGDGTQKSLSVDRIRQMRAQAFVRPNEAEKKVFLLLDAGCMNASAQNAMLKILEEPPAYVIFVITVESRTQLLSTVLSRSVSVSLGGGESPEQPQESGLWLDFLNAFARGDEPEMLVLAASVERDRLGQKALLEALRLALRDALALRAGGHTVLSGARGAVEGLSRAYTRQALYACLEAVDSLCGRTRENANGPLLSTLLCARLRAAVG